jgi:hypothetical protein
MGQVWTAKVILSKVRILADPPKNQDLGSIGA